MKIKPFFLVIYLLIGNLYCEMSIEDYVQKNINTSYEIRKYLETLDDVKRNYLTKLYDFYFPQLNYYFSSTIYSSGKKGFSIDRDFSNSNITISKNLFNNFKDYLALKSSLIQTEIQLNNLWLKKQEISFNAIELYTNYLKVYRMKEVSILNEKSYQEQFEKTKAYYEQGLISYSDVLKSELNFKTAQLMRISQENLLKNALMNLNTRIYEEPLKEDTFSDISFNEDIKIPDIENSIKLALKNRKELENLKKMLAIKENELKENKISFYPDTKIDFSYSYSNILNLSTSRGKNYNLLISLSFPFGPSDISARFKNLSSKINEINQIKRQINETEIEIKKEVISAILEINYNIKRYDVAKTNYKISSENFEIVKQKYSKGKASIIELIEAQKDNLNSSTEIAQSYYDLYLSYIKFKKSIGEQLFNGE